MAPRENGNLAKKQILDDYESGIYELQSAQRAHEERIDCPLAKPIVRGVLLMMRFHRLQILESLKEKKAAASLVANLKIVIIAAVVSAVLRPETWEMLGKLLNP